MPWALANPARHARRTHVEGSLAERVAAFEPPKIAAALSRCGANSMTAALLLQGPAPDAGGQDPALWAAILDLRRRHPMDRVGSIRA